MPAYLEKPTTRRACAPPLLFACLYLSVAACGEGGIFSGSGSETGEASGSDSDGGPTGCPGDGWNQGAGRTPTLAEAVMTPLDDIQNMNFAVGDLNGDGFDDLVITELIARALYFEGQGDGSFAAPVELSKANPVSAHTGEAKIADLDDDGTVDLVLGIQAADATYEVAAVHWGGTGFGTDPTMGMNPGRTAVTGDVLNFSAETIGVGDLDGDGILDLAAGSKVGAFINYGGGDRQFDTAVTIEAPLGQVVSVDLADLDDDGRAEIMSTNVLFTYRVYEVSESRSVSWRDLTGWGALGGRPTLRDLNGDNAADIAIGGSTHVYVAWNDGAGGFGPYEAGEYCTSDSDPMYTGGHPAFGVADLDDDGNLDIAVGESRDHELAFMYGRSGTRHFSEFTRLPAADYDPTVILPGDYNGDGKVDLGVVHALSPDWSFAVHFAQ